MFQFKEFTIQQKRSAMKVGTDAILLGSWAPFVPDTKRILDIGSGTGVLSLMLAQRIPNATIEAVEIESDAVKECQDNFQNSKWADRLKVTHSSIQKFSSVYNGSKFDLIISNPPFFVETIQPNSKERQLARNTQSLSFKELINSVKHMLDANGLFATIIPFKNENLFIQICNSSGLNLCKRCLVQGTPDTEIKRSLLCFSFREEISDVDTLIIEKSRHQYTKEFVRLTKDFYLNF